MAWIIVLILILMLLAYAAYQYGVFDKFYMEKGKLLACDILFLSHRGQYQNIGPLFEQIGKDTNSFFKFSQMFGFYYDNPQLVDPKNCRAIVGIKVNQGECFKIKQFLKKHPGYHQIRLQTTNYLSYQMPYINILSILLMVKKVYPQIHEYLKKVQIPQNSVQGMMQLYKCVGKDKKVEIMLFLENKEQFESLYFENDQKEVIRQK